MAPSPHSRQPARPATPDFGTHVAKAAPAGTPPPTAAPRPARRELTLDEYVSGLAAGDRTVLARAISLIESDAPAHAALARKLLDAALPHTGRALRVGVTGVPGAGKSTLIDRLGSHLTAAGHRLAVLAIDPSSGVSGGSILGDKTRMPTLAADPRAFIRPSPSGGNLGGIARRTREGMLLCEAAGFDVVLVETVGVGQSETAVADLTDLLLAVMIPGGGDELQGIKRGLLEVVDVVAVNKADGPGADRAQAAAREIAAALHLAGRHGRTPGDVPVLTCSALTGAGIDALWSAIRARGETLRTSGATAERRREQSVAWLHALLQDRLTRLVNESPAASAALLEAESGVRAGTISPGEAVERVITRLGVARGG